MKISRYYDEARALAKRLTEWSMQLAEKKRFIVCSGGGPGIMEAANRGAADAGGPTIGMNISLPFEQFPNAYISENLSFEYHYFFMRKFWFVYLAKALIVFPGGFGTMDELFELLTLLQTKKVKKSIKVIIYGKEFWEKIINFQGLVDWGVVSRDDLNLFDVVDHVDEAFEILKNHFEKEFLGKTQYWEL
ncbi:MAG: TIGR00730 family Rossman fold protein [candidate division KSB1 bacterium]|nr:TIGR00730 family Rossman fold protein [candidate division KSB1 bacterium]